MSATDDGRIVDAEAIGVCSVSGRRVLAEELERCSLSAKLALPEYFAFCNVTGERALRSSLTACTACGQEVAPATLEAGVCSVCRKLKTVSDTSSLMRRIFAEHPKLSRWNWMVGEAQRTYMLEGIGWIRRLRVVLDRETLAPLKLSTAARLFGHWSEVPPSMYKEYLG